MEGRWKRLFGTTPPPGGPPVPPPAPPATPPRELIRQSNALEQFLQPMHGQVGLTILDLGTINQSTTDFFNEQQHTVKFDNFVRALDESFGNGDFFGNQQVESYVEHFQTRVLNYDDDSLDGVLVWDALQYLSPDLLEAAVSQLHAILHKNAYLLMVFHTEEKPVDVPLYSYRLLGRNRIHMVERPRRLPTQYLSTRALEKTFRNFSQVKFFLTQESQREVLVRK